MQRILLISGIVAIILLVLGLLMAALILLPIERIVIIFILLPVVITVLALSASVTSMVLVPQIERLRGRSFTLPEQATVQDATNTTIIGSLARLIVVFTISSISVLGVIIIVGSPDGTSRSKSASDFLSAVLPLFGSWIGAVLAFYYGKENYEAATRSAVELTRPSTEQARLQSTPVRQRMIEIDKIAYKSVPTDETRKIEEILKEIKKKANDAGFEDWYRLPILTDQGAAYCVIHRSSLDQFRVQEALKPGIVVADLTLKDFLESSIGQYRRINSFAVVSETATLADAKQAMERLPDCQDVIVTAKGRRDEKVVGWITNAIIEQTSKV